jgi:hypothetical protein
MFAFQHHKLPWMVASVVALLSVGCGDQDGKIAWWRGEQERIELSNQLAINQLRLERLGGDEISALEELKESNGVAASSIQTLKNKKLELAGQVATLRDGFDGYCKAILNAQRQKLIGKSFDKFESISGRAYHQVTVATIDDAGVTIRHSDGSARLGYEDLDPEQRKRFGIDVDLAQAAVEQEKMEAVAYDQWIEGRLAQSQEKKDRITSLAIAEESKARQQRSISASRDQLLASLRPLAQSSTRVSSGYSSRSSYSAYRSYRPTYRYVYYTPSYYRANFSQACRPVTTTCRSPGIQIIRPNRN